MRRFAAVAITSGALVAGLATTVTPAVAATQSASNSGAGVASTEVQQGTVSGKTLLSHAKQDGQTYSHKEYSALSKASTACRWYQRTQGYKTSAHGHWLIYVSNRLTWCYDGYHVVSARSNFHAYTYNKRVWQWKGWVHKSLTHDRTYATVKSSDEGRFYYTGNRHTYKPWVTIMGYFNGGGHWWSGG